MPEGPEVATIRNTLAPEIEGHEIESIFLGDHKFRKPINAGNLKKLIGQKLTGIHAHGKLLWISVSKQSGIMFRLGMTGKLVVEESNNPVAKHTHLRIKLKNHNRDLRYVDPRRFGEISPYLSASVLDHELKRLGPDPLRWTKDEKSKSASMIRLRKRAIKEVLLDQTVIAGVGNIYASESLYAANISPFAACCELSNQSILRLMDDVEKVMQKSLKNRGTTFSAYVDGRGNKGNNFATLHVFKQEGKPCERCRTIIVRATQGGRGTFYCPLCQA